VPPGGIENGQQKKEGRGKKKQETADQTGGKERGGCHVRNKLKELATVDAIQFQENPST